MPRARKNQRRYKVLDHHCIGRACLELRSCAILGSRWGGGRRISGWSDECARRMFHGCPSSDDRPYSEELAKQRKAEGWFYVPGQWTTLLNSKENEGINASA